MTHRLSRKFETHSHMTHWPFRMMLVLAIVMLTSNQAPAKDLDADLQLSGRRLRAAFQPVVSEIRQSTVEIWCHNRHVAMGVVLNEEGQILTKASELQEQISCQFHDDSEAEGQLIAVDRDYDLALIQVEKDDLTPIKWANEDMTDPGLWVVTPGITESPMAVGVSSVQSIDIPRAFGKARMGIMMDVAEERPKVLSITPFSSASRSGLRTGDVILQVANSIVDTRSKLTKAMANYKPGDSLFVRVLRGGEYINFQLTLDSASSDKFHRQAIQNRMGAKLSVRRTGFKGVMQHDTVMSSHHCGGALVNLKGEAIGLNIARGGRTESYAIPVSILRDRVEELQSGRLAIALPRHELPKQNVETPTQEVSADMNTPEPPPLAEN